MFYIAAFLSFFDIANATDASTIAVVDIPKCVIIVLSYRRGLFFFLNYMILLKECD